MLLRSNVAITWQAVISASQKKAKAKKTKTGKEDDAIPELESLSDTREEVYHQNIA